MDSAEARQTLKFKPIYTYTISTISLVSRVGPRGYRGETHRRGQSLRRKRADQGGVRRESGSQLLAQATACRVNNTFAAPIRSSRLSFESTLHSFRTPGDIHGKGSEPRSNRQVRVEKKWAVSKRDGGPGKYRLAGMGSGRPTSTEPSGAAPL
jgi:hypothetical protein